MVHERTLADGHIAAVVAQPAAIRIGDQPVCRNQALEVGLIAPFTKKARVVFPPLTVIYRRHQSLTAHRWQKFQAGYSR
jgi:hypothetical protein